MSLQDPQILALLTLLSDEEAGFEDIEKAVSQIPGLPQRLHRCLGAERHRLVEDPPLLTTVRMLGLYRIGAELIGFSQRRRPREEAASGLSADQPL